MNQKKKYQIVNISKSYKEKIFSEDNITDIYESKSFIIKFYAYLPLMHSLREANFSKQKIVLDLGCANGPFLPTLNYYSNRAIGVDIDEKEIINAKKIFKNPFSALKYITLLNSDAENLPFRDENFDLIFCLEVLEHVKDPEKAIKEILRILKSNGVLICSLPIEIGLSLLIRTLLGKILKFRRPKYTYKELIRSVFLKKPGLRLSWMDHKNFDWRDVKNKISKYFDILKISFTPIHKMKNFNPIVIIKAAK